MHKWVRQVEIGTSHRLDATSDESAAEHLRFAPATPRCPLGHANIAVTLGIYGEVFDTENPSAPPGVNTALDVGDDADPDAHLVDSRVEARLRQPLENAGAQQSDQVLTTTRTTRYDS